MIRKNLIYTILLILINSLSFFSQDSLVFNFKHTYGFEKINEDSITRNSTLDIFYNQLYSLKKDKKNQISVFHIGDSHLQADFISHTIRTNLQKEFGNAGRGLITPLKIAKTNEPTNYSIKSKNDWEKQFCVSSKQNIPFGISGMSIDTKDSSVQIQIKTYNTDSLEYTFNTIKIHSILDSNYTITCLDTVNNCKWEKSSYNQNEYFSKKPTNEICIQITKKDTLNTNLNFSAFELSTTNYGLIYNSTGINGAKYRDYLKSDLFFNQLKELNPDLIILSLGTNESFHKDFDTLSFYSEIDSLIQKIKENNSSVQLILTTPAASYKYGKKNIQLHQVVNTILKYANDKNIALWDLYNITGGSNSAINWKKNLLLAKDGVHYSKNGYILQGNLLTYAIINGYNKYVKSRY